MEFLQYFLNGLMVGGIYALLALAFVLIFKATGVLNFAHGDIMILLSYVGWVFLGQLNLPHWLGILVMLIVAALIGLLIERVAIRPLTGQPILAVVMMTIALSYLINGIANVGWRGNTFAYPQLIPVTGMHLGPIVLSWQHIICFLVAIVLFALFGLFFRFMKAGLGMRAVAEGHQEAQSSGINVKQIFAMTWALASILAGVAAYLLGSINGACLYLGPIGLKGLVAALFGGLDSIPGAMAGGLIIGVLEVIACIYINPLVGGGMEESFPFILMILVLIFRPHGLFGLKRIERV